MGKEIEKGCEGKKGEKKVKGKYSSPTTSMIQSYFDH